MSRFAKKVLPSQRRDAGSPPPEDSLFKGRYPALWDYLTATKYDDGGTRRTSTLLAFVEEGVWKVCLNDRDVQASCWVGGEAFEGVLDELEALLDSGNGVWRPYKGEHRGHGKRG